MDENKKYINKKALRVLLGTGLIAAGLLIGLLLGRTEQPAAPNQTAERTPPPAVEIYSPATPEIEEPTATPYVGIYYFLQAQEEELRLYEVDGENRRLIKKAPVDTSMFPAADRTMLEEGIQLLNLEESVQYFEDFTS